MLLMFVFFIGYRSPHLGSSLFSLLMLMLLLICKSFFCQAEVGIRGGHVTGVQTCALPISTPWWPPPSASFCCWPRPRSEERRVGKESRSRFYRDLLKKNARKGEFHHSLHMERPGSAYGHHGLFYAVIPFPAVPTCFALLPF